MDKQIENLKRNENQRRMMQLLNMVELYLNVGQVMLEIMRQHADNDANEY